MAMLNPPELRPSVMLIILRYLASQRGHQDRESRLIATLAPASLAGEDPARDVRVNLAAAIDLRLVTRDGEYVTLAEDVLPPVRAGESTTVALIRARIMADDANTAPWGSQIGARDLTNALSWFLTFPPDEAPTRMAGGDRSANELQETDFGPRQQTALSSDDDDVAPGGWPIRNPSRWNTFQRWAPSLGFAWVHPKGHLVPDPTPALRQVLPVVLGDVSELSAREFVDRVAAALPVLDSGRYRAFVEANWRRPTPEHRRLSVPLSDALERLRSEGRLRFDDRADAARVARADGSTFSHVRIGTTP